ncbi:hypothetical protein JOM56_015239 [Amanita muscaria]
MMHDTGPIGERKPLYISQQMWSSIRRPKCEQSTTTNSRPIGPDLSKDCTAVLAQVQTFTHRALTPSAPKTILRVTSKPPCECCSAPNPAPANLCLCEYGRCRTSLWKIFEYSMVPVDKVDRIVMGNDLRVQRMEHLKSASTILSTPPTSHADRDSPGSGQSPKSIRTPNAVLQKFKTTELKTMCCVVLQCYSVHTLSHQYGDPKI